METGAKVVQPANGNKKNSKMPKRKTWCPRLVKNATKGAAEMQPICDQYNELNRLHQTLMAEDSDDENTRKLVG